MTLAQNESNPVYDIIRKFKLSSSSGGDNPFFLVEYTYSILSLDEDNKTKVLKVITVITFNWVDMKETEKSWLACAVDTDGFVSLKNQKVKRKKEDKTYNYSYILGIIGFSNTDLKIVNEFARLIEAKSYTSRQPKPYQHKYKSSTATLSAKKIQRILNEIMPYLITKKERAKYVLDFITYKLENPGDHSSLSSRNEEDHKWFENYRKKYPPHRINRSVHE